MKEDLNDEDGDEFKNSAFCIKFFLKDKFGLKSEICSLKRSSLLPTN